MNTEFSGPIDIEGKAVFPRADDGLFDTAESFYFECKYAEGFTMIVADEKQQPKGMGTQFLGSEGWIYVDRSGIDAHPKSLLKSTLGPNEIHLYESTDHIGNFLDCVASRAKTITPAEVAHRAISIAHLGNTAMKLGRKVRWNSHTEQFVNDPEADRMRSRPMRSPWQV
jgi:hypothetical protein